MCSIRSRQERTYIAECRPRPLSENTMNDHPATRPAATGWTWLGLAIALFALPLVAAGFRSVFGPVTAPVAVIREVTIFAIALFLVWIVRSREQQPLASIGFTPAPAGRLALWTLIGILGCAVALAIGLMAVSMLGLRFGSAQGTVSVKLPMWLTIIVLLRAGIVEELFYRGYAIGRLQQLTGSKAVAVIVPLLLFAGSHYSQSAGGVLITFLMGAVLTALYLWKRNLLLVMLTHFLVDFIPNVILPLLSSD